jgi:hypothetical protein
MGTRLVRRRRNSESLMSPKSLLVEFEAGVDNFVSSGNLVCYEVNAYVKGR